MKKSLGLTEDEIKGLILTATLAEKTEQLSAGAGLTQTPEKRFEQFPDNKKLFLIKIQANF